MMIIHKEAVIYVIMDGFTTLVTWISYVVFVQLECGKQLSNVLSWVRGVIFAFIINK